MMKGPFEGPFLFLSRSRMPYTDTCSVAGSQLLLSVFPRRPEQEFLIFTHGL